MTDDPLIDWEALREAAREAMSHAYVPYSHFPVGAAALVDDGRVVTGCNVENASYGVTLCAECGLVSALHLTGGGRLVAFTCVDGNGGTLMPCGRDSFRMRYTPEPQNGGGTPRWDKKHDDQTAS